MIDLNHGSNKKQTVGEVINNLIDNWLTAENAKQAPRSYVSTSGIGRNCLRQIQYDYLAVPKDKLFDGPTLRRFQSGHKGEIVMAEWLRGAGFDLRTERADGKQYGFSVVDGRFSGHIDGVLLSCDHPVPMQFPALWESKELGAKVWNAVVKAGKLAISKPVYAAQVALYQAYMDLPNPALFTARNRDTQEIYCEMVPFDAALAQEMSDRAVQVIQASDARELLPRCASSADYFECKWCSWSQTCWEDDK